MRPTSKLGYLALVCMLWLGLSTAFAQPLGPSKTLTIYIPGPAGGGSYDLYGRLLARHIGRYLPGNPTVIPSNMPGAGGIICANFLYNKAPKDGSAIAIVFQTMGEEQALGADNVQFDIAKFNWIGRTTSNVEIAYTWHTSPTKTIEHAKRRETVMGASGPATFVYPLLLNNIIGTRFKIVRGYQGGRELNLAMQRGEVEGTTTSFNTVTTTTDWLKTGQISILVQYAPQRHPGLPNVPTVGELVSAPEDQELFAFLTQGSAVGRSFAAPPGVPPEQVETLRSAFDATMKDPQLIAEIKQLKAEFDPMPGRDLQQLFERSTKLSAANRDRAQAIRREQ